MNIERDKLNISVSISCLFDIDVTSPKAKIIFECGKKTRRLPFLVTNYFRQKQSDSCIIVCTYSFYLDDIYYNYDCKDDINVRIDFYYGDNEVIGVPFTVSTNVLTENPNIELDEQYIEYECFDGVTVFSEESEFINDRKAPKNIYTFDFDCENSKFIIHQTPESRNNKNFVEKSVIIVPLLRLFFFVLRITLRVVSLLTVFWQRLTFCREEKRKTLKELERTFLFKSKSMFRLLLKRVLKRIIFLKIYVCRSMSLQEFITKFYQKSLLLKIVSPLCRAGVTK